MAMVNKTSVSHFKVKNVPLKHTYGKGNFKKNAKFSSSWQKEAFLYKIVIQVVVQVHSKMQSIVRWNKLLGKKVLQNKTWDLVKNELYMPYITRAAENTHTTI